MELTAEELTVVRRVVQRAAEMEGEDVLGILMKVGAFCDLGDAGVVVLAKKLERFG